MKLLRHLIYVAALMVACASPAAAPQLPTPAAAAAAPDYVEKLAASLCDAMAELVSSNPLAKRDDRCVSYKVLEPFHTASNDGYFILTRHEQGDFGFVVYFNEDGELLAIFPE